MDLSHRSLKIYSKQDFEHLTTGIKVAQNIKNKKSHIFETKNIINNFEDLAISDSLCCSYCKTAFDDQMQQRKHYKMEWHTFNLKQHLHGLESVSENEFNLIIQNVKKKTKSKLPLGNKTKTEKLDNELYYTRNSQSNLKINIKTKLLTKENVTESAPDNSDISEDVFNTLPLNQPTKVFFENAEGRIFGIYQCLLYNKKATPKIEDEVIIRALECGKKSLWTIIMVGGGHFAGAVFSDGNPLVHKTLHYYTVRAKQGSLQKLKDNRSSSAHSKSAGSNIRRYNETHLLQHVQEILVSWSTYIVDSSLILYRAVGAYNHSILFGGKNPPFDKRDLRLRQLPFPTSRPTYNEVKRVYDLLSTIEVYTHQATARDSRENPNTNNFLQDNSRRTSLNINYKSTSNCSKKLFDSRQIFKNRRTSMDRAKPRKSPHRPLPDIVEKLARSSSESEIDEKNYKLIDEADNISTTHNTDNLTEHNFEIDFQKRLIPFERSPYNYIRKHNQKQNHKKEDFKKKKICNN